MASVKNPSDVQEKQILVRAGPFEDSVQIETNHDVVPEIVVLEGNDPYKDSPYGSIPSWSVRFDDHDEKAIPQENLIKVFNLGYWNSICYVL
ncbi:hypothetical protein CEXT_592431 [Caerostris extrusa]|uniref:Uncharacterized protein n=1 Tax=Caerostris extrusa TaxID=172846 RepID=A0AAV4UVT8_CAEEX|nr:hypothetical protein CEXT_592431 [Caerostris extrusa]